jgi:signal recognition particle subunit SEC65
MSKDFSEEDLEDALDLLALHVADINRGKYPNDVMTWEEVKKKLKLDDSLFTEEALAEVRKELGF